MEPIPLPSHIHYELLLQLLERQTMSVVNRRSPQQEQVQELIITLRKALSQQKHLEYSCERAQIPIDYRWSLNQSKVQAESLPLVTKPLVTKPIVPPPLAAQPLVADLPIASEPSITSDLTLSTDLTTDLPIVGAQQPQ